MALKGYVIRIYDNTTNPPTMIKEEAYDVNRVPILANALSAMGYPNIKQLFWGALGDKNAILIPSSTNMQKLDTVAVGGKDAGVIILVAAK